MAPAIILPGGMPGGAFQIIGTAGGGGYTPQAVWIDATTQLKNSGPQFTGIANSKVGTISFWYRTIGSDGNNPAIFTQSFGSGGTIEFLRLSSGLIRFQFQNAAGSNIFLGANASSTFLTADGWKHFLASWDLSTTTMQMYVQDVSDLGTPSTNTNDTINYASTGGQWWVSVNDGGSPGTAYFADFWFDPTTHIDLSVSANRRKFITAGLSAVDLGSSGQLPTGTSPICFLKGPTTSFLTNLGTGGNFATNSGAIQAAANSPP